MWYISINLDRDAFCGLCFQKCSKTVYGRGTVVLFFADETDQNWLYMYPRGSEICWIHSFPETLTVNFSGTLHCLQPCVRATTLILCSHIIYSSEQQQRAVAEEKTQVYSFIKSITETGKQIEMVPGCQPGWTASLPSFSPETLCPVADKIA